jgi:hypothetical protein
MQKLITVTLDIARLQSQSEGPFSVQEIEAVSELLAEGWNIESWEFVTGDSETSKAVIMMLLNDGMDGYEESCYDMDGPDFGDDEADEDLDEQSGSEGDEDSGKEHRRA